MHPLAIQAAVAAPLVFALAVFMASRGYRSALHGLFAALLGMILVWIASMLMVTLYPSGGPVHELGRLLAGPPSFAMSPLFFLAMTRYERIAFFERGRVGDLAVVVPLVAFYALSATNDWHGLFFRDAAADLVSTRPTESAGPGWWAFQVWSNALAAAGLVIIVRALRRGPSREERLRSAALLVGVALPLLAHSAYVYEWLPIDFPLTPAALAITALLLAASIRSLGLLDVGRLARRDVIEALTDGVVLVDASGTVVDVNPAAARLIGRPREILCGQPLGDGLAQLFGDSRSAGEVERVLASKEPATVRVELPNGRCFDLTTGRTGESGSAGEGSFVVLRDRTQEHQTLQRLHQTQKLESVGVLAAGVAHEVNNPLAYVRANLEYLDHLGEIVAEHAECLPGKVAEELADFAEVVSESRAGIERIGHIVESLLRFSREPSDEFSRVDVNEAVREAIRFANLNKACAVRVGTQLDESLPAVEGSAGRLVQVLLNLLLNAKQALHGHPDPSVTAETRRVGDEVEVCIRDNGPGISKTDRDRIFDPFFTTRAPGEGSGLGLSIAFDIVREHRGSVEALPSSGPGACFRIRLPAAPVDPAELSV